MAVLIRLLTVKLKEGNSLDINNKVERTWDYAKFCEYLLIIVKRFKSKIMPK